MELVKIKLANDQSEIYINTEYIVAVSTTKTKEYLSEEEQKEPTVETHIITMTDGSKYYVNSTWWKLIDRLNR